MRTKIVAGNWKMNTSMEEASKLVGALAALQPESSSVERVLIPPFPWIVPLSEAVSSAGFELGAQNCSTEDKGAYTGEVSASMLAPFCRYIVAGHSERRHVLGEIDEVVAAKVRAILRNQMIPILCVGELLDEREDGRAQTGRRASASIRSSRCHRRAGRRARDRVRARLGDRNWTCRDSSGRSGDGGVYPGEDRRISTIRPSLTKFGFSTAAASTRVMPRAC